MEFIDYVVDKMNGMVVSDRRKKIVVFYRSDGLIDRIRFLIGKKIMPPVEEIVGISALLKREDFPLFQEELEYKRFFEGNILQNKEA